jgi:hypothetical protein
MNQIQIQIFQLQIRQSRFNGPLNQIGSMESIPQFTRDEEILTFHLSFADFILDCFSNLFLIAVNVCTIYVAVIDIDGVFDCLPDFTRF